MRRKRSLRRTMVRGSILLCFESKEIKGFFKSGLTCDQLHHKKQVYTCGFNKKLIENAAPFLVCLLKALAHLAAEISVGSELLSFDTSPYLASL